MYTRLQTHCCTFAAQFCFLSQPLKVLQSVKVLGFPHRWFGQTQAFISNYRHVSICWILPPPLPKNHPPHLACTSPAQPHPKPRQLHGAHHCVRTEHPSHSEGDCWGDHLLLHGQHAGPDGGDGTCHTAARLKLQLLLRSLFI